MYRPDLDTIILQCEAAAAGDAADLAKSRKAVAVLRDMASPDGADGETIAALIETTPVALNLGSQELAAPYLFYLGSIMLTMANDEPGIGALNEALRFTQDPLLALCIHNQLMIRLLTTGDYAGVLLHAQATEDAARRAPDTEQVRYYSAGGSYNRAEALFQQGKFGEAAEHAKHAMDLFVELSLRTEAAKAKGILGASLLHTGGSTEAMRYLEEALSHFRKAGPDDEVAFLLQNRGLEFSRTGRTAEAIKDLREAIAIFRRRGNAAAVNSTLGVLVTLEKSPK